MNKIFKIIWNHAQQRFVVTSELTRSQGKASSTDKRANLSLSKAVTGSLLAIGTVMAGTALISSDANAAAKRTKTGGSTSVSAVMTYVAYNSQILVENTTDTHEILIGAYNVIGTEGYNSTIVGTNSTVNASESVVMCML